jgi:hypothetical protein
MSEQEKSSQAKPKVLFNVLAAFVEHDGEKVAYFAPVYEGQNPLHVRIEHKGAIENGRRLRDGFTINASQIPDKVAQAVDAGVSSVQLQEYTKADSILNKKAAPVPHKI